MSPSPLCAQAHHCPTHPSRVPPPPAASPPRAGEPAQAGAGGGGVGQDAPRNSPFPNPKPDVGSLGLCAHPLLQGLVRAVQPEHPGDSWQHLRRCGLRSRRCRAVKLSLSDQQYRGGVAPSWADLPHQRTPGCLLPAGSLSTASSCAGDSGGPLLTPGSTPSSPKMQACGCCPAAKGPTPLPLGCGSCLQPPASC